MKRTLSTAVEKTTLRRDPAARWLEKHEPNKPKDGPPKKWRKWKRKPFTPAPDLGTFGAAGPCRSLSPEEIQDGVMTLPATSNSLIDLADRIDAEHAAAVGALASWLDHAIKAGELLIEAKAKVAHGQWTDWVRDHCTVGVRMAQIYMQLVKYKHNLEDAKAKRISHLSMYDAIDLVRRAERQQRIDRICERSPEIKPEIVELSRGLLMQERDDEWKTPIRKCRPNACAKPCSPKSRCPNGYAESTPSNTAHGAGTTCAPAPPATGAATAPTPLHYRQ
jgi:hypothetical protein